MQEDALKTAGCAAIYHDVISGAKRKRPGLDEALDHLCEGDTLIVWKLDRLGRSLEHLIDTMIVLEKQKVAFTSLQKNINTSSTSGKLVFHTFSALAEFERDLICDRTNAGLKAARAHGRVGGRPASLNTDKRKKLHEYYKEDKLTVD